MAVALVAGSLAIPDLARSAPYVGADIVLNGADFSSSSTQWTVDGTAIWSNVADEWAEYDVDLTTGQWQVGIEAINEGSLGDDPFWYTTFELNVTLSSLGTKPMFVTASATELQHGFIEFDVPTDGSYTARFTWLNDLADGPLPGGGFERDANIRIERVVFDAVADLGPNQWLQNPANDHAYALTDDWPTFEDAEAQAVAWGGHLVTIDEQAEQDWLYEQFGSWSYLIGLSDIGVEGTFVWASGVPVAYTNWCAGEPNDHLGEDSVSMIGGAQCWNDVPGGGTGIVEVAQAPAPQFNVAYDSYPGGGNDFIHLYGWLPGSTLTIEIDDPGTGPGPDHQVEDIAVASADGFNVEIGPDFDIMSGHEVTVADGVTSMTHTVTNLRITDVDPVTDTVSGVGQVGMSIYVGSHVDPLGDYWVDPNLDGTWTVDMSADDLRAGYGIVSHQYDVDSNNTQFDYQVPQRHFKVRHDQEFVVFVGWVPGTTLTVEIDDPATGPGADHQIADIAVPHGGQFEVAFEAEFDVQPGHVVTVDDGTHTLAHTVRNVTVTAADPDTDLVTGTATPAEQVALVVWTETGSLPDPIVVDPAPDGAWQADLSAVDLQQGWSVEASQYEDLAAGSAGTGFDYPMLALLHPTFTVFMSDDFSDTQGIGGFNFLPGSNVTLTIDLGADGSVDHEATATVDEAGDVGFDGVPAVQEGDTVTMTDDLDPPRIKTHVIEYFTLIGVDPQTDTVSGAGRDGIELHVRTIDPLLPFPQGHDIILDVDATEVWTADFTGTYDIDPGRDGWVQTVDDDGDHTQINWWVPTPEPRSWQYNPATGHYYALTDYDLSYLQAEDMAETSGGHLVTINDQAEQDWLYEVFGLNPVWIGMNDIAAEGDWQWISGASTIYTNWCPGEPNDAFPGEDAGTMSGDGLPCWNDGDAENVYTGIVEVETLHAVAHIEQNLTHGHLTGNGWPIGTIVTATIDDPDTPGPDDYVTEATVLGEGAETHFEIDVHAEFGPEIDLRPGMLINVTDGPTTKVLEVADLNVTEMDAAADTITGTAEPGVTLEVGVVAPNGYSYSAVVDVVADGAGSWTADFSGVHDLVGGDPFVVRQSDADGDVTFLNLRVPAPHTVANPWLDYVQAREWPLDAELTLTIDDDGDVGNGVLYETTATPEQTPAPFLETEAMFDLLGEVDLQAGHVLTVSDGVVTKTHEVTTLELTDVDHDADTMTGLASAFTSVSINVGTEVGGGLRTVTADGGGNWFADFSTSPPDDGENWGTGDIDGHFWFTFSQTDDDGDRTGWDHPSATPGTLALPALDVVTIEATGLSPAAITIESPTGELLYETTVDVARSIEQSELDGFLFPNGDLPGGFVDLDGIVDLVPGHVVTAADVAFTMQFTVGEIDVTEIDVDTDVVFGTVVDSASVVTAASDLAGFGSAENVSGDWSMELCVLVGGDCTGPYDITHDDIGISVAFSNDAEFDTGTGVIWNLLPTITELTLPTDPVAVEIPVGLSATFADLEVPDAHTATVDWGDGTPLESIDVNPGAGPGSGGTASVEHNYETAGAFTVTMTVNDAAGASAEATATVDVISSTVAYWPLDDGDGTVATDVSGNGHDGSVVGASWIDGLSNTALLFDGISDVVTVPVHDDFYPTDAVTVEAWVKLDQLPDPGTGATILLNGRAEGNTWSYHLNITDDGRARWSIKTATSAIVAAVSDPELEPGRWYHLAGTYDSTMLRLYVNGDLAGETTATGGLFAPPRYPLTLGAYYYFAELRSGITGTLDETAVHIRALTPTEIEHHHTALANEPPIVSTDVYATDEDALLEVAAPGVLGNDIDPEGEFLTATLVDDVDHGTLTLNEDGSFEYLSDRDFYGADSFTYEACDPGGLCDTGIVVITVEPVNDAPVATDDTAGTSEDTELRLTVSGLLANDSDAEGDRLTVSSVAATGETHGTVELDSEAMVETTIDFSWFPGADGVFGTEDDVDTTPGVTLGDTVIVNDDPERSFAFLDAGTGVVVESLSFPGRGGSIVLSGADHRLVSDVDGVDGGSTSYSYASVRMRFVDAGDGSASPVGAVTVTLVPLGPADITATWRDISGTPLHTETVSQSTHGGSPWEFTFDDTAGASRIAMVDVDTTFSRATTTLVFSHLGEDEVVYQPTPDYAGPASFEYTVEDGSGGSDTGLVNVIVTAEDDPPSATDDVYATDEDALLEVATPGVLGNDIDPEGEFLTATLVDGVSHGTLTLNEDGSFEYLSDRDFYGADSFTYEACDPGGLCDTGIVVITVDDADGVDGPIEDGAPNDGDGNADGVPDSDQRNVASLPNAVDGEYVTVEAPAGTQLTAVETIVPPENLPDIIEVPNGLTGYAVEGVDPGAAVTVTQYLSLNAELDDYWKYGPTAADPTDHWYRFMFDGTTGAIITHEADRTIIAVHFVDGQRGDSDLLTDGRVVDPGGPAIILNRPPVSDSDAYAVNEDVWLTVDAPGVLGNDTDEDGDPLTAALVTEPEHGTLTLDPDGSFRYVPDADWSGTDRFTYVANDGQLDSNGSAVTIDVTAVNDLPVANVAPASQSVPYRGNIAPVVVDVTDIDSDLVSLSLQPDPPPELELRGAPCAGDGSVACTITFEGAARLTVGRHEFTLTLDDVEGSSAVTWSIVVVAEHSELAAIEAELASLIDDGAFSRSGERHASKALYHVRRADRAGYWDDDGQLANRKVFTELSKSVRELAKIDADDTDQVSAVEQLIDRIVELSRRSALYVIDQAIDADGNQRRIDRATAALERGDVRRADDQHRQAISHYQTAWRQATRALG